MGMNRVQTRGQPKESRPLEAAGLGFVVTIILLVALQTLLR